MDMITTTILKAMAEKTAGDGKIRETERGQFNLDSDAKDAPPRGYAKVVLSDAENGIDAEIYLTGAALAGWDEAVAGMGEDARKKIRGVA